MGVPEDGSVVSTPERPLATPLRLSAVIPTRNRAAQLPETLSPLLRDPDVAELIVVDDHTTDGTADLLAGLAHEWPKLVVVTPEGNGKGAASQAGLEAASGEVVLFLDDDVVAHPGLAAGHLRHHRTRAGLVVMGYMPVREVLRRGGCGPTLVYHQDYERTCRTAERSPELILHNLWGGNVSMRRDDALRVGLRAGTFDPRWRHLDRELGLRCLEAGLVGVFDRALGATHHYERDLPAFLDEARWAARGRIHLHHLHPDVLGPFRLDDYFGDLSQPRAAVVRLGSSRFGHRLTRTALVGACRLAARLGRVDEEIVLTRLARRTEHAYHARQLTSAGVDGSEDLVA